MRAALELLHRLLVDVRGAIHRKLLDAGGQRNWAGDTGARALGGLDDLQGGLIDDAIVVALKFDADALTFHDSIKNEGLSTGGSLRRGLDDFGKHGCRHLFEMGRSDRCTGTALGEGANIGHITEESFKRNFRGDNASARLVFHTVDTAATTIDVTDKITLEFFWRGHFYTHDRLEKARTRLLHRILKRENTGHLKGEFGGIDFVERTIDDADDHVDDREASDDTIVRTVENTLGPRLDKFFRDRTANNVVNDFDPLTFSVRLHPHPDLALFTFPTSPTHKFP